MLFGKKNVADHSEKRAHERIDLFLPTYCTLYNDVKNSSLYECWINNISLGGMSLKIKDRDLRDFDCDRVNLIYRIGLLQRKDRLHVRHMGRVLSEWKFGCQFVDIDPQRESAITEFFRR